MIDQYNTEVFHFHLMNGTEMVARLYGESEENQLLIENPMMITVSSGTILLAKMFPFSPYAVTQFDRSSIVSYALVADDLAEYYIHSLNYSEKITEKHLALAIREANLTMRSTFNDEAVAFAEKAAKCTAIGTSRVQ